MPVATGTTGSARQFSVTTTLPSGGYVRAVFAGDTDLAPSVSNPAFGSLLAATHVPSRLVLDPVSSSVPAGTPVTFSGTMQVEVNGTSQPFQGAPLTFTGAVHIHPAQRHVPGDDWFSDYASASYNWIDGVSKTKITGFSLPAKDEAHQAQHNGMYATGTVDRWNGSSWPAWPTVGSSSTTGPRAPQPGARTTARRPTRTATSATVSAFTSALPTGRCRSARLPTPWRAPALTR